MKFRLRRLGVAVAIAGLAAISAAGLNTSVAAQAPAATPPAIHNVEAKPAIAPGSKDTKSTAAKGATKLLATKPDGTPAVQLHQPAAGNNSNVDFSTIYNYCYGALTYTTVYNYSSVTQYYEVVFYNNGQTRTVYRSVAANSYDYPTFYGTMGAWTAYLYVYNTSTGYTYDQYETSNNTCSLTYSLSKYDNYGNTYSGYLYASIKNNGTAYPYAEIDENTPYYTYGTYTGDHWYYPAAGATAAQYVYVGVGIHYEVDINPAAGSTYYTSHYSGTY